MQRPTHSLACLLMLSLPLVFPAAATERIGGLIVNSDGSARFATSATSVALSPVAFKVLEGEGPKGAIANSDVVLRVEPGRFFSCGRPPGEEAYVCFITSVAADDNSLSTHSGAEGLPGFKVALMASPDAFHGKTIDVPAGEIFLVRMDETPSGPSAATRHIWKVRYLRQKDLQALKMVDVNHDPIP